MTSNVTEKLSYPALQQAVVGIIYSHVSQAWPIGLVSQKTFSQIYGIVNRAAFPDRVTTLEDGYQLDNFLCAFDYRSCCNWKVYLFHCVKS